MDGRFCRGLSRAGYGTETSERIDTLQLEMRQAPFYSYLAAIFAAGIYSEAIKNNVSLQESVPCSAFTGSHGGKN